ncbi:class A beta-lactamase-related serine hydrolase, partial [Patescibacteria group bacterium]|nr:class A beta-lactamase-related serine hydrolase [Patescibacteria group bacterium]
GQLQENQVLSQDATVLNQEFNIDANSAEQTEGEVTFTVADALTQMITVSDNYAALLLTEKVGLSAVATFLKENGFSESALGSYSAPPTTTPYDTTLFFKKLYQGELADQQDTNEMINLLENQQLNNGLPKYLPKGLKIAHKTAEIDSCAHDAGIVFTDNGNYILVVMSQSDSPPDAMERIALISRGVFDSNQKPR